MKEVASCLYVDGMIQSSRKMMMQEKEKRGISGAIFLNIQKNWDLVNKWRVQPQIGRWTVRSW